ncbi:MAG TPA: protease pro-enzyme activation domain-containing protein, partial [Candidatus Baltobacteraceae bacterium]|nr:protease pro-enzyme activation domain-containing protein [Candidatus Baltobacteraceae bacterium]
YRNEPDISMPAEDVSVRFNGTWGQLLGTSWSSPEYAALMAEVLQYCGLSGGLANAVNVPYYVASHYPSAYLDVTSGNDQFGTTTPYYTAAAGYDNASGFGVPYGMAYANTACPGRTKASGLLVRSAFGSTAVQPLAANAPLDVTPRVSGLADRGRRSAAAMTRVQIVLRSDADRSAVEQALEQAGFTIDRRYEYRAIVHAQAPSQTVERYFSTQLHDVLQARYGTRYMPVTPIALPQSVAPYVRTVNLDNVVTRHVLNGAPLSVL